MTISDLGSGNAANGNYTYKWAIEPRASAGASNAIDGDHPFNNKSEPLLVGTNTTGNLTVDFNQSSTDGQPLVVGTNSSVKITVIGGGNSSTSRTVPVVVGTNNTVIGAENLPHNGQVPLLVATNSTVEFVLKDDTYSKGSTPLVLGTNITIGSQEDTLVNNALNNKSNYQWNLTGGDNVSSVRISRNPLSGEGDVIVGDDSLSAGGSSLTAASNADFFRNLFGAGQAPNPDYIYDFGLDNSGGNFRIWGVDFNQFAGTSVSSLGGDPLSAGYSFGDGMTNSNNSGVNLPIVGTNNTIF